MNEFKYVIKIKQSVLLKTTLCIGNGEHLQNSLYVVKHDFIEGQQEIEFLEHFLHQMI